MACGEFRLKQLNPLSPRKMGTWGRGDFKHGSKKIIYIISLFIEAKSLETGYNIIISWITRFMGKLPLFAGTIVFRCLTIAMKDVFVNNKAFKTDRSARVRLIRTDLISC